MSEVLTEHVGEVDVEVVGIEVLEFPEDSEGSLEEGGHLADGEECLVLLLLVEEVVEAHERLGRDELDLRGVLHVGEHGVDVLVLRDGLPMRQAVVVLLVVEDVRRVRAPLVLQLDLLQDHALVQRHREVQVRRTERRGLRHQVRRQRIGQDRDVLLRER